MEPPAETNAERARSLAPYAVLAAAFAAGFYVLGRGAGRRHDRISFRDVAAIGAASADVAHVVARDKVAVFVRAPFAAGPAALQPQGGPMRRAVGELLTCPKCLALWVAAGFWLSLGRFPRGTRLVAGAFAAHALADLLLLVRARLRSE